MCDSLVILDFYWWDTIADWLFRGTGYRFTAVSVEKVPHSNIHKTASLETAWESI